MESNMKQENKGPESIAIIERFFALIDSGTLFASEDSFFLKKLRQQVLSAISYLLFWGRPFLEVAKGLDWPYEGLRTRFDIFRKIAEGENNTLQRQQALLFLAFLPFPYQWSWLFKVEKLYPDDREVKAFLVDERKKGSARLQKKTQKKYKVRHFCQVLKAPRKENEKGVLRIFSLPYLFDSLEHLLLLSRRYLLIVEPPWGVIFRHTWLRKFSVLEDPSVFGVNSTEDINFLRSQLQVVPFGLAHGDYMSESFEVKPSPVKEFDLVFNATFDEMKRKRHELMLELLNHHLLKDTRALFLGRGQKAKVELFRRMVRRAGLQGRVTVMANLLRENVPTQLSRCKVGVHLSLNENGCRSIYEYFRSDLPCVVSSSMAGTNLSIFSPQTGMAVTDDELPTAISFALNHLDHFTPRRWFLENSGSVNSSKRLNQFLQELFQGLGYQWQTDIVPLISSGPGRYANAADYESFREEFGWIYDCLRRGGELPIQIILD
jgi:hypothetical protein